MSGSSDLTHYPDPEGTNKPKPYVYLETAKRLQVAPARCLVFEDTEAGVAATVDAGMNAIAVPNAITAGQDFSRAHAVISDKMDLNGLEWALVDRNGQDQSALPEKFPE